jgi:hypothetical protein
MEDKKKCKQFSLDEKKKTLEEIRGMKKADVARKYGISPSPLKDRKLRTALILMLLDCREKEFILRTMKKWAKLYAGGFWIQD